MAFDEDMARMQQLFDEGQDWIHHYMMEYDDEQYERDVLYMQTFYPPMSRELMQYVSEVCDREEYEGSPMFDEYPDKIRVGKMVEDVYEMASYMENMYRPVGEEDDALQIQGHCVSCRGRDSWLKNLIAVLLSNEMHHRRRRYFKRRKALRL